MSRSSAALAFVLAAAACGGDDGGTVEPVGPLLVVPAVIDLPYVEAGAGASTVDVAVANPGDAPLDGLAWTVIGDADFTIVAAPSALDAGGDGTVTVQWTGAADERIAGASLSIASAIGPRSAELWAVAGDPALAAPDFTPVTGAGGVAIGDSAILHLPTAPFPASGRPWTDDRAHVFIPADYRELDAHDVVLHFHGHGTTIDQTVPAHAYREQLYASGLDAILVVPQGPVNTASGDFGKLSDPAGTAAFLDEILIELYRAGRITRPVLGQVTLTSHSGGYVAVAQNLAPAPFVVGQIDLFDSVYGYLATYRDFALAGGRLRSDYTSSGGTDDNNRTLATQLTGAGATVATTPTQRHLQAGGPVIYPVASTHEGSTRDDAAYAEQLRWSDHATRRGPRVELRSVVAIGGVATVRWLAPPSAEVGAWRVETSTDGATWTIAAEVTASSDLATFPLTAAAQVRVVSVVDGVADPQPSDVYRVGPDAGVLVVDGFDRVVDGSWGRLSHAFAAKVGAAAGVAVHTVSNEAITEDGFALGAYRAVIWLVGDESSDDHSFSADERAAIDAYVAGGGHIVVSGSEIGYDLGASSAGASWLARTTGATFAADSAGTSSVHGVGPFAALAAFDFGGAAAPYREEFPDTFSAGTGAMVVLRYGGDAPAAVGVPGKGVIVGFPLETIESPAALAALVPALLAFVAP